MTEKLAFVGKIIKLEDIPDADFISSATVVCGIGGKWRGVVQKGSFNYGDKCMVFLPDCVLPENNDYRFMEKRGWRVRMMRFKGAPSEVLIMPLPDDSLDVGYDASIYCGVSRYFKEIPANMQGKIKANFPSFVPRTDELNYQMHFDLVDKLHGLPYYITEKADGSSTTAYKHEGNFGLCSRNYELQKNYDNGYWKVEQKYSVEERLPDGYALQWETVGPKIQKNPMGFKEIDGRAFSAYNINERRYLEINEFMELCQKLEFPTVHVVGGGGSFDKQGVELLGEGTYLNGKQREGVVVRSCYNFFDNTNPISFKVINLNYDN